MAYEVLFQYIPGENEESRGTTLTTGSFSDRFDKDTFRTQAASLVLA
jgi:hypothetical protein